MYDLKQLASFVELARSMHFGRAAETLGISTSTLSAQIRSLEEAVGAPLVNRANRTIDLTRLGEAFLPDARRILALVETTEKKTAQILAGEAAAVRLGVCPSVCELGFLTRALRAVRSAYPSIDTAVVEGSPAFLTESLARGKVDLVLSIDYGLLLAEPLRALRVAELRPVLAAARETGLVTPSGAIDLECVKRTTFFGLGEAALEELPHIVESLLGAEPGRVVRVRSLHVIRAYVEAGYGAALLPAHPADLVGQARTANSSASNPAAGPRSSDVIVTPVPDRRMNVSVIRNARSHAPVIGKLFDLLGSIDYVGEGARRGP